MTRSVSDAPQRVLRHRTGDNRVGPLWLGARAGRSPQRPPGRSLKKAGLIPRKLLACYEAHFNTHCFQRARIQASALRALPDPAGAEIKVIREDRLRGLLYEYAQVAWDDMISAPARREFPLPCL